MTALLTGIPLRRALTVGLTGLAVLATGAHAKSPKVTEFQLPRGGSTHEIVMGPGGNLYVTQQKQAHIVRVTPRGHKRIFQLPADSGPHGIDFDANGRIWITLEFANQIAMVDRKTGRILKRYDIPSAGAGPHGLRVASNGRVWWTGKSGNNIGYVDPGTGKVAVFALPNADSTPIYIVQGCDGMYFTELTGSRIGRITDAGTITEWSTPTQESRPIAVAPQDCRVWFSEESGHHYGVLDPQANTILEYPLSMPDDQLTGLAFDGRGKLWLQHDKPDSFGYAGPAGELGTFPIPTKNAVMHRLIRGPHGRMWFTELAADKVGFFKPPA